MTFNELKKNSKKDFTGFKKINLALLGDSATQFLAQAIRGYGFECQYDINIYDADFNQIERQILDLNSELYVFRPEITVIFESGHKLLQKFNKIDEDHRVLFAEIQLKRIIQLCDVLQQNLKTKIIFFNYAEEDDRIFGNFANKVDSSFIFQQRKLNYMISEYATKNSSFYICDISTIQNKMGRDILFSTSIYINSEMVLSIDALPIVAESVTQMIVAFQGKFKKCIILDLDNTLWGGVIGDDGINNIQIGGLGIGKAFTEFQHWLKKLQQRGIILCICSKNKESVAKEPFKVHPDMVLRLNDIAVFLANWETKVDNIQHIKQILNIGFDSMVFIDDNPFERNMVRQNIPDISVPELPNDPADYLEFLYSLNLFETISFSVEDTKRTEQYQKESERIAVQALFANENDFLKSLNMCSDAQPFNSFSIPRVAQLSQRSNQFNLRTIRYTEDELRQFVSSDNYFTFSFSLEDKYGDNGLICAIILEEKQTKKLFIDSWFMSCRVLKRSMENFVLNYIVEFARNNGYQAIIGEYLATEKNELVKDHYARLGFVEKENFWYLSIASYQLKECFINLKVN
jgi:FkbH-like protein